MSDHICARCGHQSHPPHECRTPTGVFVYCACAGQPFPTPTPVPLGERIALAIEALPLPPKEGVASSYMRGLIDGYRTALDDTARIARETT